MISVVRHFVWLAPLLLLMGCSSFPSSSLFPHRDKHYLYARSIPPLRIPAGISSTAFHNQYPVSDRQYSLAQEDISLVPPGLDMKS